MRIIFADGITGNAGAKNAANSRRLFVQPAELTDFEREDDSP